MPHRLRADQGFLRAPLTAVFRSAGAVRVLRALSRHGGLLAVPTLERAAGLTNAGAHRVLRALADTGVVRAEGQGRVTGYRVDAEHPLAQAIAALFAAEDARADRVFAAIRDASAPHEPEAVWLFGSAARSDDAPGSDVDVAVVFRAGALEAALDAMRTALRPTEDTERVAISVIGLWPEDVARLSAGEPAGPDPLWRALERDAVPLVGPPPALLRPSVGPSGVTRRGPERQVDERFWAGRLDNARTFRRAAEALSDLAEEGENANPIVALIVLAAVGYGDALTARVRGVVNRPDYQALPRAVRDALGNRAHEAELGRLRRFLAEKDVADYGARYTATWPPRGRCWPTCSASRSGRAGAADPVRRPRTRTRSRPGIARVVRRPSRYRDARRASG